MEILQNQILANYTTSKIGGRVRWMFFPENSLEIIESIKFCVQSRLPFFILAGGSNTIFEDKNLVFRQAVINLSKLNHFQILDSLGFSILEFEPGVRLQKLVDLAQQLELKGVSGLNRIPGTIGGATIGNAGAYGVEIGSVIEKVEYIDIEELVRMIMFEEKIDIDKLTHSLNKADCRFRYRQSYFKDKSNLLVTRIWVKLSKSLDFENERSNYAKIAKQRDAVYPVGFVSPGSVFKNILIKDLSPEILSNINPEWIVYNEKIPVAKLLESVGSKTLRIGGISMRSTHANIMINHGGAQFSDVIGLIKQLQDGVKQKFGIEIEPEIRLVPADFNMFRH
jgi:UDP-N-acetylmuramate dehydrogenase